MREVPIHHEAGVSYAWQKPKDGYFVPVLFQSCGKGPNVREQWRGVWTDKTVWILFSRRDNREELTQRLLNHWSRYPDWEYRLHPGFPFSI